jgi:hypothetical protein
MATRSRRPVDADVVVNDGDVGAALKALKRRLNGDAGYKRVHEIMAGKFCARRGVRLRRKVAIARRRAAKAARRRKHIEARADWTMYRER